MKSREEIKAEIELNIELMMENRQLYKEYQISKEEWDLFYAKHLTTITTLKWVLNENDRFD